MNRTDRLYAMVEELRAVAPSSRTAQELADVYEVSTRTIERDILALQEAGVPIRGVAGRRGGYSIDPARTLPPVNFSPAEALAVAIALADESGPFAAAGRAARNKVLAAMSADDLDTTRAMAERVRHYTRPGRGPGPRIPITVERAITRAQPVQVNSPKRRYQFKAGKQQSFAVVLFGKDLSDSKFYSARVHSVIE